MNYQKVQTLKQIVEDVCKVDFTLKSSKREVVNARAICYDILRNKEYMTVTEIGRHFTKHHSTVLLTLKNFKYMLMSDAQMRRDSEKIEALWAAVSGDFNEVKPVFIKKELKYLREQNKMLNLSLNNVQEQLEQIKKLINNGL
ncbi:MAG: hypothetical protein Unbinned6224contig1000_14 [Prokaryotic dsDNA virus sp.]|nr:MAG: hypothetical protein Unbinned6224contig1000_14 [Prokaryotic dsDNA virus sp.]|tara:strand:+ start:7228 stop:7656 length:429 start_codon:yes stop_codon:yes gene_type:complete